MKTINIRIIEHFSISVTPGKENKTTSYFTVESEQTNWLGKRYWKPLADWNHDLTNCYDTQQDAYNAAIAEFGGRPSSQIVQQFTLPIT